MPDEMALFAHRLNIKNFRDRLLACENGSERGRLEDLLANGEIRAEAAALRDTPKSDPGSV